MLQWVDTYHTPPALTDGNGPNFGIKILQEHKTIHVNNSVKTYDILMRLKKKVDEIFFPLFPQEKLNWFWHRIIVQPFLPLCSWEVIAFFSEQEPPPSFLPNGGKASRLEHDPSQNLIRICQFVIWNMNDSRENLSSLYRLGEITLLS